MSLDETALRSKDSATLPRCQLIIMNIHIAVCGALTFEFQGIVMKALWHCRRSRVSLRPKAVVTEALPAEVRLAATASGDVVVQGHHDRRNLRRLFSPFQPAGRLRNVPVERTDNAMNTMTS